MNPQIVTVNLIPGLSTPAVVRVSQYDVERPITFRVLDGNKAAVFPDDCTATIEATKPSGLGFSLLGTIAPGGIVNFTTAMSVTQECGMFPAEIRFSTSAYGSFPATDIGTANFILAIEPSPHPEGTTDGTQETMQNLETRLQSEINDLSDRIDDIEAGGSGLSQTEKNLILTLFSKAAYAEDDAGDAYDALEALWTTTTRTITYNLSHVSSSNTTASIESGQSYTTTLTVSTDYTLNSVTVTMGGVDITSTSYSSGTVSIPSVTGNIVITATAVLAAESITAVYTQSGTVYDTDSLDSLKADLVVTANYSGGASETVPASDYTLSGTLTEGTSTITVSYAGLTATFSVTVVATTVIYDTANNDIVIVDGGNEQLTAISGEILSNSGNSTSRRSLFTESGEKPVYRGTQSEYVISSYYPIPIPSHANHVDVSCDIATHFNLINIYKLENGQYTLVDWTSWAQGSVSHDFTAGENLYLTTNSKRNSSGTSYSSTYPAPSRFVVTFTVSG